MAIFEAATNDDQARAKVICNIYEESTNPAANQSTVRVIGSVTDNSTNFGGNADRSSWSVSFQGTVVASAVPYGPGSFAYDFTGNSGRTYTFFSEPYTVTHNNDGSASATASVTWTGISPVGSATASGSISTAAGTMTDFVRLPSTPAAPTLARSNNGATLTITGATSTFFGSSPSYQYRVSANGGSTWYTSGTLNSSRQATITVTNTDTLVAQTRAIDSEGTGAYSASSSSSTGVPATPSAAPTLTRTTDGTSITVTSATATRATAYSYRQSLNGSTWGDFVNIASGTSVTITNRDPQQIYYYQTRGRNTVGFGAWSATRSIAGAPTIPTVNVSRSGLVYTISGSSTITSGSISNYEISRRSSTNGGSTYTDWTANTTVSGTTSYTTTFTSTAATTYQFRVRAKSSAGLFSDYGTSSTVHTPAVPLIPTTAISLSRSVRNVTIDWATFRTTANTITQYNGASISSYEIQERYSDNNGATWLTSYTNIGTTPFGTTVFTANNRLIAKTYQFRVRAVSDVGNSSYQESGTIFVSAYGSRSDGNGTNFVPIENAKIFLGIGQAGADANGWKTIENVKRFVGIGQSGADANGWTDLQT
jgi:hypothetical protein